MPYYRRFRRTAAAPTNNQFAGYNNRVNDPALKDRLEKLLNNQVVQQSNFTIEFLKSLLDQFNQRGSLSHAQVAALEKNESKYSDENVAAQSAAINAWKESFDADKRTKIKQVASWYKYCATTNGQPYYYMETCEKVLNEENYLPSESLYKKIVENKYSQTFLNEVSKSPKFSDGDVVCIGPGALKTQKARATLGRVCNDSFIVIEPTDMAAAVKGGRIYKLLPIGGDQVYEVEERFLRRAK